MIACQVCGKREATIKITRLKAGVAEEFHCCEECAAKVSPLQAKLSRKKNAEKLAVEGLLAEMIKSEEAAIAPGGAMEAVEDIIACPTCGLDFQRYKNTGMLGCPDCYDNFGDALLSDIRKLHHATEHVGGRQRVPSGLLDVRARMRALRSELDQSVEAEDYRRAAELRDEIRKLEEAFGEA